MAAESAMVPEGGLMALLAIRHITTYRYRRPVAFGEHRMRLRPRDTNAHRVTAASLVISPSPTCLRHEQDDFGNHVQVACFSERARELTFESNVTLEHLAADPLVPDRAHEQGGFPCRYATREGLAPYLTRKDADRDDTVRPWAEKFLLEGHMSAFHLLSRMSEAIREECRYRRREEKGIQQPEHTLRARQGSCRDFAVLLIAAARSLGFAARFASGYLAVPIDWSKPSSNPSAQGATHAWAQVLLPDAGWISFDPTCGGIGDATLVTVAVAAEPGDAIPLHGSFFGCASDHLRMDVVVRITRDPAEPCGAGKMSTPRLRTTEETLYAAPPS